MPLRVLLSSRLVTVGFAMIVLALLLSAVAVFVSERAARESTGVVNGTLELRDSYLYSNRTLTLGSENATVRVSWGNSSVIYNISGEVTVSPSQAPRIDVINGTVTYTYREKGVRYPYSYLSIPAAVLALTGTILLWLGYTKLLEGRR